MAHYGTWVSYSGDSRIVLAIVLLAAAAGFTYAGIKLQRPATLPRPGKATAIVIVAAWIFSLAAFAVGLSVYINQLVRDHLAKAPPSDPIAPVTLAAALAIFVIILVTSRGQPGVPLVTAAIGAMAAPMIFEFPFDLIVMGRTYPAVPPDPALYRAWFFVPLFLIELTTLSLLALCPRVKISRPAIVCFALMLTVFAIWALIGFAYPSAPLPIAFNVVSKLIAFAAALSLFVPRWFSRRGWSRQSADDVIQRGQPVEQVQTQVWSGVFGGPDNKG
jgi:hypothetical protein